MAANSSIVLSSLDFDTLKQNFKEFMKTQTVLKDFDYDGSNINVLLDVMAYNSYLNSFYLNMVASEMFLDTAQKYDSVVSHAKELNYLPRSTRSSSANLSITLTTEAIEGKLNIPKGTRFTGFNSNGSYVFTTDQAIILSSPNEIFTANNIQVFEGDYYKDSFVVDYNIENQRFEITNQNVDTNSLTVNVVEDNGSSNVEFTRAETLFGLDAESTVYFLQPSLGGSFEVVFGDNLFGRKPKNGAILNLSYRVASGPESDGATAFVMSDDVGPVNAGQVIVSDVTVVAASSSGAEKEDVESIRFAAPRYFATQQRAISTDDYAALIFDNFGGEISDVVVYGGQDIEPKLYGRVIIALKPTSGIIAPDYIKNRITNYLKEYIALPNRVIITDPDYTYCKIISDVQYDPKITTKTVSEIQNLALKAIINYSTTNLEKFGNDLRFSRLSAAIDNSDTSITSNDTDLRIIKRITPNFNVKTSYEFVLGNILYYDASMYSTNEQHKALHDSETGLRFAHATMISSNFTYNASDGKQYELAFFEDDANGNVVLYAPIGNDLFAIEPVGTIDYLTGKVSLTNINVADYPNNYISLYFRSRYKDIYAEQNKIIVIDSNDVEINVIETMR
jgi:uncharacterized phage protein gp47/JayE